MECICHQRRLTRPFYAMSIWRTGGVPAAAVNGKRPLSFASSLQRKWPPHRNRSLFRGRAWEWEKFALFRQHRDQWLPRFLVRPKTWASSVKVACICQNDLVPKSASRLSISIIWSIKAPRSVRCKMRPPPWVSACEISRLWNRRIFPFPVTGKVTSTVSTKNSAMRSAARRAVCWSCNHRQTGILPAIRQRLTQIFKTFTFDGIRLRKRVLLDPNMRDQWISHARSIRQRVFAAGFSNCGRRKAAAYLNFDFLNRIWVIIRHRPAFSEHSPGWVLLGICWNGPTKTTVRVRFYAR